MKKNIIVIIFFALSALAFLHAETHTLTLHILVEVPYQLYLKAGENGEFDIVSNAEPLGVKVETVESDGVTTVFVVSP